MDVERTTETETKTPQDEPVEYAIVEVFGWRRLGGRVMEVERFGTKMLRIDIPTTGDFVQGFTTMFYAGAALFSVTPTDLATVCRMNRPYEPGVHGVVYCTSVGGGGSNSGTAGGDSVGGPGKTPLSYVGHGGGSPADGVHPVDTPVATGRGVR